MYGKQLHPHCMNAFTQLNTKRARAGDLITAMVQQLLRIRSFVDPGLALADSLGIRMSTPGVVISWNIFVQNSVFDWVRDHRVHHKFSETDADPHNAHRGFFFSHVGWLMQKKHPEVIRRGRQVDMSDILADPLAKFHTK